VTKLAERLKARIEASGPIGVDAFIAAALTDAECGYYATGEPLGAAGDFITAPEISAIFGELIGLWVAAVWRELGEPSPFALVELGPGRGTLLTDALRAVDRAVPACAAALRPVLIEVSRPLKAAQAQALATVWRGAAPVWLDDFAHVGAGPLIVLANEFFDALPIRQFVRVAEGWRERLVGIEAATGALTFVLGPLAPPPPVEQAAEAAEGAIVERCPAGEALAAAIAARLAVDAGAALIIDYGPRRSRPGETLQAVRRHRPTAVLDRPGEVDLSHHVDFAALAKAARRPGVAVFGPVPQGLFLGRLGIAERAAQLITHAPAREADIAGRVRRLVHPGRMGVLFNALALMTAGLGVPPGFASAAETAAAPSNALQ
jgi:NADH dehydrogenase [ubiquinone] 1 alpha subcomplex assembly factor 7